MHGTEPTQSHFLQICYNGFVHNKLPLSLGVVNRLSYRRALPEVYEEL